MKTTRGFRAIGWCALATVAFTACTKSTATPLVPGSGGFVSGSTTASIRFVNGSPDANGGKPVDFTLSGAVEPNGQAQAYGTVSAYSEIPAGVEYEVDANDTGTTTGVIPAVQLDPLGGMSYTIVLAGRAASTSQAFLIFTELTYTSASTQAVLNVHHASPGAQTAGITTFSFGSFTPGGTNFANLANATYPGVYPVVANGVLSPVLPASAASAPGVELYAVPSPQTPTAATPPSSAQSLLPSAVVAADTGNILPDTAVAQPFTHLSLFVIDASTTLGYELIGVSD